MIARYRPVAVGRIFDIQVYLLGLQPESSRKTSVGSPGEIHFIQVNLSLSTSLGKLRTLYAVFIIMARNFVRDEFGCKSGVASVQDY